MAVTINAPSRCGGIVENAYCIITPATDNQDKKGKIEFNFWVDLIAREGGKLKINTTDLPFGADEIWEKDEAGIPIYISQAKYSDFAWKSGLDCYTKIKEFKIKVGDDIIDLSQAVDLQEGL